MCAKRPYEEFENSDEIIEWINIYLFYIYYSYLMSHILISVSAVYQYVCSYTHFTVAIDMIRLEIETISPIYIFCVSTNVLYE